MQIYKTLLIFSPLLVAIGGAQAASHVGAPNAATSTSPMAEGEVRKVDANSKKITIKHGEIKNLDMPPMTMVFQVADPALLTAVKAGDKVRFKAEKSGTAIVITEIQPAK